MAEPTANTNGAADDAATMAVLDHLKAATMIKDGLSAPLHKGAIKAYKELGLMK